jgi:flavin reductase (DIM6/NTAB) family NADH-FMN oxidoreductase RutF
MNHNWKTIELDDVKDNVFKLIGSDWMLITSGSLSAWNTMTASWGSLGILWGKSVCFCFVRDTRHTYEFMNKNELFSLSFFDESHRAALDYCGTKSGRDVDKAKETGLAPVEIDGTVSFQQSRLVMVCKKIYNQDIDPDKFIDPSIHNHYAAKDYHRMYIGEITSCYSA